MHVREGRHRLSSSILTQEQETDAIYVRFGDLLGKVRNESKITQVVVAQALIEYAQPVRIQSLGLSLPKRLELKELRTRPNEDRRRYEDRVRVFYARIERCVRAPKFSVLLPVYLALTAGCGARITDEEKRCFITLARHEIEKKTAQYREPLQESDWTWLKTQIATADGVPFPDRPRLALIARDTADVPAEQEIQAAQNADQAGQNISYDVSHIVGRDEWCETMIAHLSTTPRKKIIVVQAMTGVGKTTAAKLLATRLMNQGNYTVFPMYRLQATPDTTAQDHLDMVLAKILQDIGRPQGDAAKPSLEQRLLSVIKGLQAQEKPVVLLIDDFQIALDDNGSLAPGWQQWFSMLLEKEHRASLILSTREWPLWNDRAHAFVEESMLPHLLPAEGAQLFAHLGYADVPDNLLQEASKKCGGNANYIELKAASLKRPCFTFEWDAEDLSTQHQVVDEKPQINTQLIQAFLREPSSFDNADLETRTFLDQVVFDQHLSFDAFSLLELLAIAGFPLASPILKLFGPEKIGYALNELQRNSFLDTSLPKRVQLLPLVREAGLKRAHENHSVLEAEQLLIRMYQQWLLSGTFSSNNEREKGDVVAELTVLFLRHQQLMDAANVWIRYGWLAVNQGHAIRVARFAQTAKPREAEPSDTCGKSLLRYLLHSYLGIAIDDEKREKDYVHIHALLLSGDIVVDPSTDIHITHHLVSSAIKKSQYQEAHSFLETCSVRIKQSPVYDEELHASLLEQWGWLFGTWCEYSDEQEDGQTATALRLKAIDLYNECKDLLLESQARFPLQANILKKRLARCYNNIGYHQNRLGKYKEALPAIQESIRLKKLGYVQIGSLAASYSEQSIALAGLGLFKQAYLYDELANNDIEQYAQAGYKLSQEDKWMYAVNRGRLYYQTGKINEAEQLLQEAIQNIPQRRRWYMMLANETLQEIQQWRRGAKTSHFQLDWRWVERFRYLSSYDTYWWLAAAGPFTAEEQRQWDDMRQRPIGNQEKDTLVRLLMQSRERELENAIVEQREPKLHYPCIDIDDVRTRIAGWLQLSDDIKQIEKNALVQHLYQETIEEDLWMLLLIEATYEQNTTRFQQYNRFLNPPPTQREMEYALSCLKKMIYAGMQERETQELSQDIAHYVKNQFLIDLDLVVIQEEADVAGSEQHTCSSQSGRQISAQTAKRFFDVALKESGFEGWTTFVDTNESGARVEQGLRKFYIPDKPLTVERVRHFLSHELAGHAARCVAGEHSILGLLGIHTRNSLVTEEGLAVYHDRQTAILTHQSFDASSIWIGTLATGLASGIASPPQKFLSLYTFFEKFLLLRRLTKHQDPDTSTALKHAKRLALVRCLRTFRGVPDLEVPGISFSKDALYLRGLWLVEDHVSQNKDVLKNLGIGVVAIEQLPLLQELEMRSVAEQLWQLAQSTDLDHRIRSFEEKERTEF